MNFTLKKIDTEAIAAVGVILLVALGLGFLVYSLVDCAQGTSVETAGTLSDKLHYPAWSEQKTIVVQDGKYSRIRLEVISHPERFVFSIYDGGRDIAVERAIWLHYQTGDWVKLRKRYGKRSKCKCNETVL